MLVIHNYRAALVQSFDKLRDQPSAIGNRRDMMIRLEDKNLNIYLRTPEDVKNGCTRGMSYVKILLPNNFINNPIYRSMLLPSAYGGEITFYPEDAPV